MGLHHNNAERYQLTSEEQVRQDYWRELEQVRPKLFAKAKRDGLEFMPQNKQPCTIRCDFVDFVDCLVRNGDISEELGATVTL